jgi:signal transduction histidine kinase
MMFTNARLRLTAFYAGTMAIVLVALGVSAYFILRGELDSEIEDSLERAMADILLVQGQIGGRPGGGVPPGSGDGPLGGRPGLVTGAPRGSVPTDVFTLFLRDDGAVVLNARNVDPSEWPLERIAATASTGPRSVTLTDDGASYRLLTARLEQTRGGATVAVVGRSLTARNNQLESLALVLGAGGAAGLLLSTAGGFWLAGRTLDPIRRTVETQRRFVSDASHELRTPIAVVAANADLLLGHADQTVDENIDQVAAISDEARQMSRLVNDLLILARADEGKLNLDLGPVAFRDVVEAVAENMAVMAQEKAVELRRQLSPVDIEADPVRIRQLVTILLDNAVKYTPPHGTVTVSLVRRGSMAELQVADTGRGIAPADLPRIFDRFYRLEASRTAPGTGLGLSIARTIAEAHGGRISAESVEGKGSTFTVRLPLKR